MPQPNLRLSALLSRELFTGEAMAYRRWLSTLPNVHDISVNLPGESSSLEDLVHASLQLLQNRGLLDADFFHRLAGARPNQRHKIAAVMQECLPGGSLLPPSDRGADCEPPSAAFDLTPHLLDGAQIVSIGNPATTKHRCTLLTVGDGQGANFSLDRPFSPPLSLHVSPRSMLIVAPPDYLTHARMRKAQSINLIDGPEQITATQSQPSLRRTTIQIYRGVIEGGRRHFEISQNLRFTVARQLGGTLITLHSPESGATLIFWLQCSQ